MTILPVVERELRVAARRRSAFYTRLAAGAVAVAAGAGGLWFEGNWASASTMGGGLFGLLAGIAFLFCLVAGPVFTADVLSEEKREGTLGLLFLTDLRGYDVVGGKLAAASVTAAFSLLATLPVLAIPILMGGVSLERFGQTALALGNALFFSLAAGVLVSAVSENARSAFALTGFLLFLWFGFLPWLADAVGNLGRHDLWWALVMLSPSSAFLMAQETTKYTSMPLTTGNAYAAALAGSHAVAWVFLALAGRVTARIWHEQARSTRIVRWRERWLDLSYGTGERRRQLRTRLLARNPVLWLGSRHRLKRGLLWGFVVLALGVWSVWRILAGEGADSWGSTFFIAWFLQAPLKWLMASEASQRWAAERQSGGLELLLTTPLTVEEILRGQWLAFRRLFGVPAAAVLTIEAVFLTSNLSVSLHDADMAAMTAAGGLVFLWDLHALAWVGLWLGLVKRRPNRAFLGTVFRVLAVPWLAFFLFLFFTGAAGWASIVGIWVLACAACNLLFQAWARRNLKAALREIAAAQFGDNPSKY